MARDHKRERQCAISGPGGHAQDLGICGSAFPLARTQRRCPTVCEDLPHLPYGEIEQSAKGRFTVTLGDFLKEMVTCNHRLGHRPARVQWLDSYCGLHGQTDKNGISHLRGQKR